MLLELLAPRLGHARENLQQPRAAVTQRVREEVLEDALDLLRSAARQGRLAGDALLLKATGTFMLIDRPGRGEGGA